MPGPIPGKGVQIRTTQDLERAAKTLSRHFDTDAIVVVGSQSVLVGWPTAPELMRTSGEIDAYPVNARLWEKNNPDMEASEMVAGLFGQDSPFHEQFGFYIDGVDDRTSKFSPGWKTRAVYQDIKDDTKTITVIAPCNEDIIVAKLHRLADKDKSFIEACHRERPLDVDLIKKRLEDCQHEPEIEQRAMRFLDSLPTMIPRARPSSTLEIPPYPPTTHAAFISGDGRKVTIRKWNPEVGFHIRRDNPLGPAVVAADGSKAFAVDGKLVGDAAWQDYRRSLLQPAPAPTAEPTHAPGPKL